MKYQSSNSKIVYNIIFEDGIKKRYICPECSHNRKHSKEKVLEYYPDSNRAFCFHCNTTFFEYKPYEKKQYVLPEWKNITQLSDKAVKWFTGRMIKQETLIKMKIYTDIIKMSQFDKEVEAICFPFFRDNELVNIKYRGPKKTFMLNSGSELIFWNIDCLNNFDWVIICEGEMDALTYMEIGFENVLSVPNGANKNMEYLDNYIDLFKPLKKILISTDNDTKGIELRDEFIRRLGIERCYIVNIKECKDANDFMIKYSGNELKDAVKQARQIAIKGIIDINNLYNDLIDLYQNGIQNGLPVKNNEIDEYCTFELGKLMIVTGEPNSGKSEFVDYLCCRLNLLYDWKCAYFTPENYPLKYHYAKLYEKFVGKKFKKTTDEFEFDTAYDYIKRNFFYILNEDDLTIRFIIDSAKYIVSKEGIKILIIDPYNKIDHQYDKNQSETQYISHFLDLLLNFARFYNVLVILIAHPTKLMKGEIANLYSISGSAHFFNKTDYGLTVVRLKDDRNIPTHEVQIHWQKFRFKHLGHHGISNLIYNYNNGRYEPMEGNDVTKWDNTNWLITPQIDNNYSWIEKDDEEIPY